MSVVGHAFSHLKAVGVTEVAVCLCDKDAAVLVSQPPRDHLEVDAGLDGVGAEEMTHTVVSELWYAGLFGGTGHQRSGALDRGDIVRIDFAST